jgi:hypothetical protein
MFRKAERRKAKLRLGLCGPSGSGKTKSALLIAKGISDKIAFIDTENGSGDLYSNMFDYDILTLKKYSPQDYVNAIKAAEKEGYEVLIIDSLTHAWSGEGGVLSMVDNATNSSSNKNSYFAWRYVTPQHNLLVETILKSNLHIIATMRAKTAYEINENEKGKKVPTKIGLAPIQREGMDYEFTCVLDLSIDGHVATSSKDRTEIFDGRFEIPTIETGIKLKEWLNGGVSLEDEIIKLTDCNTEEVLKSLFGELWVQYRGETESQAALKKAYDDSRKKFAPQLEVVNG